jgi:hypothetical protein
MANKSFKKSFKRLYKVMCKIDEELEKHADEILDAEVVNSVIADTNALGWSIEQFDTFIVRRYGRPDLADSYIEATASFSASGAQDEDKTYCGTSLEGQVIVRWHADGKFEILEVTVDENSVYGDQEDEV